MIFASTGTKKPEDPKWKYVAALAGSYIQTNPPSTNDAIAESDVEFLRQIDLPASESVQKDIEANVDFIQLEQVLMREGIAKFAKPQQELIALIGEKRAAITIS